jgi:hypothetical protein
MAALSGKVAAPKREHKPELGIGGGMMRDVLLSEIPVAQYPCPSSSRTLPRNMRYTNTK